MITIKTHNLRLKRLIVFIVYIAFVITFTFIVRETLILRYSGKHEIVLEPFRQYDYFLHGTTHMQWFWQIFLNILLFLPFGFMFPINCCSFFRKLKVPELSTVLVGSLFSLVIEAMQYITGRGLADIDDFINNSLGAILGYLIYRTAKRNYEMRKGSDN